MTAPMSRREEVEEKLLHTAQSDWPSADEAAEYRHLSLTLADEVDYLRETRTDRDAVITKLLERIDALCSRSLYERACEIAGRNP